jgi:hypothetical protein
VPSGGILCRRSQSAPPQCVLMATARPKTTADSSPRPVNNPLRQRPPTMSRMMRDIEVYRCWDGAPAHCGQSAAYAASCRTSPTTNGRTHRQRGSFEAGSSAIVLERNPSSALSQRHRPDPPRTNQPPPGLRWGDPHRLPLPPSGRMASTTISATSFTLTLPVAFSSRRPSSNMVMQ